MLANACMLALSSDGREREASEQRREMNVVLSESEQLPARSGQRRRRIRTTFTSGELDALDSTERNTAALVLHHMYEARWCLKGTSMIVLEEKMGG